MILSVLLAQHIISKHHNRKAQEFQAYLTPRYFLSHSDQWITFSRYAYRIYMIQLLVFDLFMNISFDSYLQDLRES